MNRPIYRFVPPLVCDFSGASSVLFNFPSLNIFYCPASCTQPIAECDEIRDLQETLVFHSVFGEVAAVMGADAEFLEEAEILYSKNDEVEFVTFISTPVPAIVGSDLKYMAAQLQEKIKKPVIVISTTGFESYYSGVQQTLAELAKNFLESQEKIANQINFIGYTPLSLGQESQFKEIVAALKEDGFVVRGLPADIKSISDFQELAKGSLNVVLSHEGAALAQYMKKSFDTPYLLDVPVGQSGLERVKEKVGQFFQKELIRSKEVQSSMNSKYSRAVVIGEPLFASCFAKMLKEEFGIDEAASVSAYEQERKLKKSYKEEALAEVRYVSSEEELEGFIKEYQPDIIFGDPLYQKFLKGNFRYVRMPHVGLSGRLYSKEIKNVLGTEGTAWVSKELQD